MNPIRLANGNLLIPMRAEGDDGLIGDAWIEIGPDHPDFDSWEQQVPPSR